MRVKKSLTPIEPFSPWLTPSLPQSNGLLPASLTTACALLIYILTLAPDLTWANFGTDGGELITAAVTLGVPHPPGYPTYVLLGKLISWLPLGTLAYRFNLFSAVCVAGAAGFVTATVVQRGTGQRHGTSAVACGLCLAFAPLVWGQAVITEVYGLNLLLVAALLWALLGQRPSTLTGFLFGLCLTTHLTSLLLLPLVLILTPRPRWSRFAVGLPLGLLPLLAIPLLARSGSPVVWGQPDTWQGWWWLISGSLYRPNLFTADWQMRLVPHLRTFFTQFTWLTLPLLLPALLPPFPTFHLFTRAVTLPLFLTALLYFLYTLTYNTHDALILLLPAILLGSLLLAETLHHFGRLAFLLPLALLLLNFTQQNLREEQMIRSFAIQQLQAAPTNAILLMSGEGLLFTLWYFQHGEGLRPDLILVDKNLFAFDWHRQQLQKHYPDVMWPSDYNLDALIRQTKRPICQLNDLQTIDCYE